LRLRIFIRKTLFFVTKFLTRQYPVSLVYLKDDLEPRPGAAAHSRQYREESSSSSKLSERTFPRIAHHILRLPHQFLRLFFAPYPSTSTQHSIDPHSILPFIHTPSPQPIPFLVVTMSVPKSAFQDIEADGRSLGRLNFILYPNTPRTATNFGTLCEGYTPRYPVTNRSRTQTFKQLHYRDTYFHRIIPNFMLQGGDLTDAKINPGTERPYPGSHPGTGGESIYGAKFPDENFANKHEVGALSMANSGPNTNGSQVCFFSASFPTFWSCCWHRFIFAIHALFQLCLWFWDKTQPIFGSVLILPSPSLIFQTFQIELNQIHSSSSAPLHANTLIKNMSSLAA